MAENEVMWRRGEGWRGSAVMEGGMERKVLLAIVMGYQERKRKGYWL